MVLIVTEGNFKRLIDEIYDYKECCFFALTELIK